MSARFKSIDFSHNCFCNEGLQTLAIALVENPKIEEIVFSPCEVYDKKKFEYFFDKISERGVSIKIDWPEYEMDKMRELKIINETEVETFKKQNARRKSRLAHSNLRSLQNTNISTNEGQSINYY